MDTNNIIKNIAKDLKTYVTKEDILVENKHRICNMMFSAS